MDDSRRLQVYISSVFIDGSYVRIPLDAWAVFKSQQTLKARGHPEGTFVYHHWFKVLGPIGDERTAKTELES